MRLERLEKSREKLQEQQIARENDFHNIITYITAGALGLFVTINEKFIDLQNSTGKWLVITSILFLIITFVLVLAINYVNSRYNSDVVDVIDSILQNHTPTSQNIDLVEENKLMTIWSKKNQSLQKRTIWILITLTIGVVTEIIFLSINIMKSEKKTNEKTTILINSTEKSDSIYFEKDTIRLNFLRHKSTLTADTININANALNINLLKTTQHGTDKKNSRKKSSSPKNSSKKSSSKKSSSKKSKN
jgi:hypothetical protein